MTSGALSVATRVNIASNLKQLPRRFQIRENQLLIELRARPILRVQAKRYASTTSGLSTDAQSAATRFKNLILGSLILLSTSVGYFYVTDARSSFHQWLAAPAFRFIYSDAEQAHEAGTRLLKALFRFGMNPRERGNADRAGDLRVEVFGQTLSNPLGTSAGIDKHADIPTPLLDLGPAVVEVGGTTPLPQNGNPRPRVFRLPSQNALINRYGLNSEGAEHVAMQLRQRVREFAYSMGCGFDENAERIILDGDAGVPPGSLVPGKLLAVQVAKNKFTPDKDFDAVRRDYVFCVDHLGKYADIIVVNVSSPNTPGLRSLQEAEPLRHILTGVVHAAKSVDRKSKPAVMVKVSPDEDSDSEIFGICQAVWASGVDGVIVGNTTKKRPDRRPDGYQMTLKESQILKEEGGFSGPHTFEQTLSLVKKYRKTLDEALRSAETGQAVTPKVIFASGGITNGRQALEVLNAGASVAMVYTALVYGGINTITRMKSEMRKEMADKTNN